MPSYLVQGAGGGIGHALVRALLRRPEVDRVVATARDPQARPELARTAAAAGDRLVLCSLDVADEDSIRSAAREVARHAPRLHGLFACSGVLHDADGLRPEKRLEDLEPAMLARSFTVNAIGPLLVVKHLLPLLRHEDRCVVAHLSARVGSIGDNRLGGWYGYRASKAALNMLTRTLALELQRRSPNAICVALHPGTVDTALSEPFQRGVDPAVMVSPDAAAARLLKVIDALSPSDTGSFLAWDGSVVPW